MDATAEQIATACNLKLKDGLYRVQTKHFTAGFIVRNGRVTRGDCAPILWKRLMHWATMAKRIGDM
jgi:hypothetical protein